MQTPSEEPQQRRRRWSKRRVLWILSVLLLFVAIGPVVMTMYPRYGLSGLVPSFVLWLLLLYAVVGYGVKWGWLGLVVDERQGPIRKTVWEWLDLLIVPILLLVGGFVLNGLAQSRADHTDQQVKTLIEQDRSEQTTLQAYLDNLAKLITDENLRKADPGAPQRVVAGAQTLTVLEGLSPERKRIVVQFLDKVQLIQKDDPIVDISSANLNDAKLRNLDLEDAELDSLDLKSADLHGANLEGVNLASSNLRGASLAHSTLRDTDLDGSNLRNVDLEKADLSGASLSGANMLGADLKDVKGITQHDLEQQTHKLKGAIMPDGSKHT